MNQYEVKSNQVDMVNGNLLLKLIKVALPLILTGLLQLLYNSADLIVCGNFGSIHSVGAISATNPLVNLALNLCLGFSVGGSVLLSKCIGQNDKERIYKVIHSAYTLALILGFISAIIGVILARYLLILMQTQEEVLALSTTYLMIYFAGLPFALIYNFGSGLLRALGDSKRPFIILTISGLINIGLNLLFVIIFKMDVAGVSLATIISEGLSALLITICLLKEDEPYRLHFKKLRIYSNETVQIIQIGLPASLQGAIFSISNILIQSSINSLGTNAMDGSGASASLENFCYIIMNSIATTSISFVSQNYGAGRFDNIKKVILYALLLATIGGIVSGWTICLFGRVLLSFYVKGEALELGYTRLIVICSTYFLCGWMDVLAQSLRGLNHSLAPALICFIGSCLLRIIYIFTLWNLPLLHSLQGVSLSYPLSYIVTNAILFIFIVKVYKEEKKRVK